MSPLVDMCVSAMPPTDAVPPVPVMPRSATACPHLGDDGDKPLYRDGLLVELGLEVLISV